MKNYRFLVLIGAALLFFCFSVRSEVLHFSAQSSWGKISTKSWKDIRDHGVVKQDYDFSCGAASLATILNEYYGQKMTEEVLLKAMGKENGMASFADMQKILPSIGFHGQGFAANFEQLSKLEMPVIVYLKFQNSDHFSVVRGIGGDTVWLADSSFGNQTFSRVQFLDMWGLQGGQGKNSELKGKFFAIFPISGATPQKYYFSKMPERHTRGAVRHMGVRYWN